MSRNNSVAGIPQDLAENLAIAVLGGGTAAKGLNEIVTPEVIAAAKKIIETDIKHA